MSNQRHQVRTPMKCRIKISHPSFGDLLALTRDLSESGVYVRHPQMAEMLVGTEVIGQVQDLPFPAPVLKMRVVRIDTEGAGLIFLGEN